MHSGQSGLRNFLINNAYLCVFFAVVLGVLSLTMGQKSKQKTASIQHAREAKAFQYAKNSERAPDSDHESTSSAVQQGSRDCESESECDWDRGVNHFPSDSDWDSLNDSDWETDSSSESDFGDVSELEGDELVESLQAMLEAEMQILSIPTPYEQILKPHTSGDWKKAERNRRLGYNKLSGRTQRREALEAREKEKLDSVARER
jgi:hypothetical protein